MAIREVYIPSRFPPFYEAVTVEFEYNAGFAACQKQKNILAIHEAFSKKRPAAKVLEISSKSLQPEGVRASAFNLMKYVPELKRSIPVENVYQGSKVFSEGGPYPALYEVTPREAKGASILKESGYLTGFFFNGKRFPLNPETAFYSFIYINALLEDDGLSKTVLGYDAFTDVEFNPQKSVNCQAKAAAVYVSLFRMGKLEMVKTFETFMAVCGAGEQELPEIVKKEEPKPKAQKAAEDVRVTVGTLIRHKLWGEGYVTEAGGTLTVLFEKVGTKKLSTDWVIKNCKIG